MNFYKRHIGDYIKAAGHLNLLEHGVYTRLMDVYYTREEGIPEDKAARLISARSKDELKALQNVLDEFFHIVDGLWIQSRCEAEIDAASAKGDKNRENGKKGGRPPKVKTEDESGNNPDGSNSGNHVGSENNLSQTPDSRLQTPDLKTDTSSHASNSVAPGQAGESDDSKPINRNVQISVLLRARQVKPMTGMHPLAIEWADNPKITDALLLDAIEQARQYKPEGDIHPNYLRPIITEKLNPAPPRTDNDWRKTNPGIDAKGRELGLYPKGTEGYPQFADRIAEEIRKRKSDPSHGGKAA